MKTHLGPGASVILSPPARGEQDSTQGLQAELCLLEKRPQRSPACGSALTSGVHGPQALVLEAGAVFLMGCTELHWLRPMLNSGRC